MAKKSSTKDKHNSGKVPRGLSGYLVVLTGEFSPTFDKESKDKAIAITKSKQKKPLSQANR